MNCYLCDADGAASGGKAHAYLCAWCMRDLGYDALPPARAPAPVPVVRQHFASSSAATSTNAGFVLFADPLSPQPFPFLLES